MSLDAIKQRVGEPEYKPDAMRGDIFYLLTYADRCDRIIAKAMEDPTSELKIAQSTFTMLQNDYMRLQANHEMTCDELEIMRTELNNMRSWVRNIHKLTDKQIEVLERVSYTEAMQPRET